MYLSVTDYQKFDHNLITQKSVITFLVSDYRLVANSSCDFSTSDQCGFMDTSAGPIKWTRVKRKDGEWHLPLST